MIRINKYLSQCGIASRRGAEKLLIDERVKVNDEIVSTPGRVIDEDKDIVKVDDVIVRPSRKLYYILLNKPANVLTSLNDPFKRKTVAYFVKKLETRVYPVGRLDYDTEGALLMTNDGELAYRLSHPKYQVKKIYLAVVDGAVTMADCEKISAGLKLEDGHIGKALARPLTTGINQSKVEMILTEGHKREVKQLLKLVGHPVRKLTRVEFAGLRVDDLKRGRWRHLKKAEITQLRKLVELE